MNLSIPKSVYFFLITILISTSCFSVKFINSYDEVTEKTIYALQEDVTRILVQVESNIDKKEAKYEHFALAYENIKIKLQILETRVEALDKNRIVKNEVSELKRMLNNMEQLHKMGFKSREEIALLNQPIQSAFGAMIRLQLAIKKEELKNKAL